MIITNVYETYNMEALLSMNKRVNVIYGNSRTGKTYAVKKYLIEQVSKGKTFTIVLLRKQNACNLYNFFDYFPLSQISFSLLGSNIYYSNKTFYIEKNGERNTVGYVSLIDDIKNETDIYVIDDSNYCDKVNAIYDFVNKIKGKVFILATRRKKYEIIYRFVANEISSNVEIIDDVCIEGVYYGKKEEKDNA